MKRRIDKTVLRESLKRVCNGLFCKFRLLPVVCLSLMGLLAACEHRELSPDEPDPDPGKGAAEIIIHWDGIAPADKPQKGMAVYLSPSDGQSQYIRDNLTVDGGRMTIPGDIPYITLCYDHFGNDYINFRNEDNPAQFEAYGTEGTGSYTAYGPGSKAGGAEYDEPTVVEPYPYNFYVAHNEEPFTLNVSAGTTLHFYPQDVTREFTFLIIDVAGTENITGAHGAISGMSSTYRMCDGVKGTTPNTVLFGYKSGRVQWYPAGQQKPWTQDMLDNVFGGNALLADWPVAGHERWPGGWLSPDSGWTGDWIMGSFCTFGPADTDNISNRLTVEVLSARKGYYYAQWGGTGEDTVREQIAGALGQNGTREEQLDWRRRNGGFDIILYNDGRLVVSDAIGTGEGEGFRIDVGDFNNINVPVRIF
jgi:hypothetical protein